MIPTLISRLSKFFPTLFIAFFLLNWCSTGSAVTTIPDWKKSYLPKSDAWRKTAQHFVFNNSTEPDTIDPALVTGVPESRIADALFEGLISLDPKTLQPRPAIAESWKISDDGLRYTFYLRKDARWSNDTPITAPDFYQSWKRVLMPETGAAYAYQLFPVRGAEEFAKGQLDSFSDVGINVIDNHTLDVQLKSPCSYFLNLVAFHTLFAVPVNIIKKYGDRWVLPENIVCSGAFTLKSWKPRQKIELIPNPHYWDGKVCKLERVTVLPYDDLDTAYRLYLNGDIHWMPSIPVLKLDEIKRHPDYYAMPYLGSYFYRLNVTRAPFTDVRVRKAFSLAIDRKILTEHVLKGGEQPATWFCPPIGDYAPIKGLTYNRVRARELLREAGYGTDLKRLPDVEVLYNTSEGHKKVAEAIAQQWKDNLKVNVSLRNTEWKVLLNDMNTLNYQISRSGWIGDYGDPNTFFDMFVTGGGNNRTGWSSDRYDDLLQRSQLERDTAKRNQLFKQMEAILVEEEFPIIPLYIYVNKGLLRDSVYGWFENIRDLHSLKYVWLEE